MVQEQVVFSDPIMRRLQNSVSLADLPTPRPLFAALCSAIISQQLSTSAALSIKKKFLNQWGGAYPEPYQLQEISALDLRSSGISMQKATYLQALSAYFVENAADLLHGHAWDDELLIQKLTKVKGVGRWTVQMVLIFDLHRPDVFPKDDLVIQRMVVELYGLSETGKALGKALEEIANNWKPHRSLASRYLWAYYGQQKNKK